MMGETRTEWGEREEDREGCELGGWRRVRGRRIEKVEGKEYKRG
jgi:hypothetical protein